VIGRFPGETSCLTLVWAVLDLLITNETNGIRPTQLDRQHLNRVRYSQDDEAIPKENAPPHHHSQPAGCGSARPTPFCGQPPTDIFRWRSSDIFRWRLT
jgi:hypothetical protein